MSHNKCQQIGCDVAHCKFNDQKSYCTLDGIQVSPCSQHDPQDKEHASMCASFQMKAGK